MTSEGPFQADDFGIYYILAERAGNYSCRPAKQAKERQPHAHGVTGLRNSGNTCYMNAILQCLCSVSPLVEYFLSGKYITALRKSCGEVATAFAYLMTDMWLGDADSVSADIFRSALGSLYPAFMKRTQQDAQEFLIYVLNELHEALKKVRNPARSPGKGLPQKCCRKMVSRESSIITRLFEGQLSYGVICLKCENCTYKNEVFTVLSLPIPTEYQCSLQDCLRCFFQQDTLTWNDQLHCSFCETKQEAAVRASIAKAPKIIVFHLKRFQVQGTVKRKLRADVHYPLTNLDLTPYICPVFRKHPKYNLCAVVNHFGDLDGGHYTAFCKSSGTQTWFSFDDSRVSEIPGSAVQTSTAYLLFYSCQPFSIPSLAYYETRSTVAWSLSKVLGHDAAHRGGAFEPLQVRSGLLTSFGSTCRICVLGAIARLIHGNECPLDTLKAELLRVSRAVCSKLMVHNVILLATLPGS